LRLSTFPSALGLLFGSEQQSAQGKTHQRLCYEVLKVFGITGRQVTPDEADMITRWQKTYGFGQEMILEACRRTANAIHKPEFNYVDKILSSWKDAEAFTMAEVLKLDKAFTMKKSEGADKEKSAKTAARSPRKTGNRFNNFTQRTYNYSDLEKKLAQKVQEAAGSDAS
jgi:DnaD/phage-associated family protein